MPVAGARLVRSRGTKRQTEMAENKQRPREIRRVFHMTQGGQRCDMKHAQASSLIGTRQAPAQRHAKPPVGSASRCHADAPIVACLARGDGDLLIQVAVADTDVVLVVVLVIAAVFLDPGRRLHERAQLLARLVADARGVDAEREPSRFLDVRDRGPLDTEHEADRGRKRLCAHRVRRVNRRARGGGGARARRAMLVGVAHRVRGSDSQ